MDFKTHILDLSSLATDSSSKCELSTKSRERRDTFVITKEIPYNSNSELWYITSSISEGAIDSYSYDICVTPYDISRSTQIYMGFVESSFFSRHKSNDLNPLSTFIRSPTAEPWKDISNKAWLYDFNRRELRDTSNGNTSDMVINTSVDAKSQRTSITNVLNIFQINNNLERILC